jgi:hypothetical protein
VASTERVPATIADQVQQVHVIDVSDVIVDRGPAVSWRAHQLDARAFTETGTVFLPAEAGDLGTTAAALLGHELTHVAQQREFGADLPAENTDAGQELEAEARSVEQWLAGGPQPPRPMRHLRPVRLYPVAAAETPPAPFTAVTASVQQPVGGNPPELGPSAGQPLLGWSQDQGPGYGATAGTPGAPDDIPVVPAAAIQELLDRALASAVGLPEQEAPHMAGTATQQPFPAAAWPIASPPTPLAHLAQAASPTPESAVPSTAAPAFSRTLESASPSTAESAVPLTFDSGAVSTTEPEAAHSTESGAASTSDSAPIAVPAPTVEPASAAASPETGPHAGAGSATTSPPSPAGSLPAVPWHPPGMAFPAPSTWPGPAAASLASPALASPAQPSPAPIPPVADLALPPLPGLPPVPGLPWAMPPSSRPAATGQGMPAPAPVPAMPPAPPAGPAIPAAALASALKLATTDTLTGTTVVPATAVAQALMQETASPLSAGPAVPMADIERVLASATFQPPPRLTPMQIPVPPPASPGQSAPVLPQRAPLGTLHSSPSSPSSPSSLAATATLPWSPPQPAVPFQVMAGLDGASPASVTTAELTSLAELVGELIADEPPRDWLDLDNSDHLDRLTAKIYDRLSDRLRRDVLVQRERSGNLMDPW